MKKLLSLFCLSLFVCSFIGCDSVSKEEKVRTLLEEAKVKYDSGNNDDAIRLYTEAIKLDNKNPYSYSDRGEAKINKEDFEGAIEDINKALELKEDGWFYDQLGRVQLAKNDFEGAIEYFNKALDVTPEDARTHTYLSRGNAKANLEDIDGAIQDYDKAVQLDSSAWILVERGRLKIHKGDFEGAIEDINKALELSQEAWIYADKADAYRLKGEKDTALQFFKQALSMDPNLDWVKKAIEELEAK